MGMLVAAAAFGLMIAGSMGLLNPMDQTAAIEAEEGDEPTAEQLAAMEAADEASAAETPEADPEN